MELGIQTLQVLLTWAPMQALVSQPIITPLFKVVDLHTCRVGATTAPEASVAALVALTTAVTQYNSSTCKTMVQGVGVGLGKLFVVRD